MLPKGFRFAGVYCGIKSEPGKLDLSLIVCDRPAVAAGVYTQNLVCAAPVIVDRERTPSKTMRAVVVNSGCANACTGLRGLDDAKAMCRKVGDVCGFDPLQSLVMSTGVIGEFLSMPKIEKGIEDAAANLADSEEAMIAAARGMMTTDTVHKIAAREITIGGKSVIVAGMAKGAAMIGPNMATMLGLVLTDAKLRPDDAQSLLRESVDATFNCITVDGHTSTNDTVLLLADGAAVDEPLDGEDLQLFGEALRAVCEELARAIPADGEGAEHLVTITVEGCRDEASARRIAKTVADSPLVKTAIAGADPNWGRIVSAAGYSGIDFDPENVWLELNGMLLFENGSPVAFDEEVCSLGMKDNREVSIRLAFGEGDATARFWTTDLTQEYVRLNADYRT